MLVECLAASTGMRRVHSMVMTKDVIKVDERAARMVHEKAVLMVSK